MAKTISINATSRASMKIRDNFYTFEYTEERSVDEKDNIEEERQKLWDTVNDEVDKQLMDVKALYSGK